MRQLRVIKTSTMNNIFVHFRLSIEHMAQGPWPQTRGPENHQIRKSANASIRAGSSTFFAAAKPEMSSCALSRSLSSSAGVCFRRSRVCIAVSIGSLARVASASPPNPPNKSLYQQCESKENRLFEWARTPPVADCSHPFTRGRTQCP